MKLDIIELERVRTLEENEEIFKMGSILQGAALEQIKRLEQYKGQYGSGETWEAYCKNKGIARRYAEDQIKGYLTYKNLAKAAQIAPVLPSSESQVRSINQLPPEQQVQIWQAAVDKSGGRVPTAKIVEETKRELTYVNRETEALKPIVNQMVQESFERIYDNLEPSSGLLGLSSFNPLAVKDKFEQLFNEMTRNCDDKFKREFIKWFIRWGYEMYPSLRDENEAIEIMEIN
jgi:hypothetical protein